MADEPKKSIAEVPNQIFEEFLSQMRTSGVSEDVILRLHKVIIEEGKIRDKAIQEAIFPENNV